MNCTVKAHTALDCLNTRTKGSNYARDTICTRLSVLSRVALRNGSCDGPIAQLSPAE
jgi:hypothetical protein